MPVAGDAVACGRKAYGGRRAILGKIRRILFEKSEDPMAPNACRSNRRRIIHNAYLIQTLVVLAGLGSIAIAPLVIILMTVPYFTVAYIMWALCTGTAWLIIRYYVIRLNRKNET